jgi:hypothetical protein
MAVPAASLNRTRQSAASGEKVQVCVSYDVGMLANEGSGFPNANEGEQGDV